MATTTTTTTATTTETVRMQVIDFEQLDNGTIHLTGLGAAPGQCIKLVITNFKAHVLVVPKKGTVPSEPPGWTGVCRHAFSEVFSGEQPQFQRLYPLCGYQDAAVTCLKVPGATTNDARGKANAVAALVNREDLAARACVIDEISAEQQLYIASGVRPSAWLETDAATFRRSTTAGVDEYAARYESLRYLDTQPTPAPAIVGVVDIECNSQNYGFPDPTKPKDYCEQICLVVQDVTGAGRRCFALSRQDTDAALPRCRDLDVPTDDVTASLETFGGDEAAMLLRFTALVKELKVTHLVAHNGLNFDVPYLVKRARHHKCQHEFLHLSNFRPGPCRFTEREIRNNQLGDYKIGEVNPLGLVVHDTLMYFRKAFNLSSYSLNSLGDHFLGGRQKLDMPPREMFRLFQGVEKPGESTATCRKKLEDVLVYCIRDCILTMDLVEKVKMIFALYGLSSVTTTNLRDYNVTGEQRKSYNVICSKATKMGYFINRDALPLPPEGYPGATVLEPSVGLHTQPILGLDFASLYPSIMQAYNLCFSTIEWNATRRAPSPRVADERRDVYELKAKFLGDAQFRDITVSFVKADVRMGVLPTLLSELLAARKGAKEKMKAADNEFDKMIYDQLQKAYKISCNAIYGFCGVQGFRDPECDAYPECCGMPRSQKTCDCYRGLLSNCWIAQTVTKQGRYLIDQTAKAVLEKWPDAKIVYGDTDSCYVKPDLPATVAGLKQAMDLGEEMAAYVTSRFPKPVLLEFENAMWPFLQKAKKRYICVKFEDLKKGKRDAKGVELVRRDNSAMLRDCYQEVFEALLPIPDVADDAAGFDEAAIRRDVVAVVERHLTLLRDDELPVDKYVISKQLAASYKSAQLHRILADKIGDRVRAGTMSCEIPMPGDRINFVIVQGPDKKLLDRAEDPGYQQAHGPPIDRIYYATQLKSAICGITDSVLDDLGGVFDNLITTLPKYRAPNQQSILAFVGGGARAATPPLKVVKRKPSQDGSRAKAKKKSLQSTLPAGLFGTPPAKPS